MTDYDGLIKELNSGVVSSGLMRKAAKAIEELRTKLPKEPTAFDTLPDDYEAPHG